MKRNPFYGSIHQIFIISLLLAACTLPGASGSLEASGGLTAWLDQPLTSATLPLSPFTLKAHAQNPDGGVEAIEFQVNGVTLTSVSTDSSQPLVYAEFAWNPSAAGQYEVRALAVHGAERGYSAAALVCVSAEVKEASAGISASDCGQGEVAPVAPPIEITPSKLQLDFKFGASPDPVYYGQCTTEMRTLNFEALVYDLSTGNPIDPTLVSSVSAHYVIHNAGGASADFLLSLNDVGGGAFTNSIDIDAKASSTLGSGDGTIEYWIEVLDTTGATARSIALTLNLINCKGTTPITATFTPGGVIISPQPPTKIPVLPPPADSTPPVVGINFVSATDVYYTTGCGPNSLTVQASVTDASGVGAVNLIITYVGTGSGDISIPMSPIGGNTYQAVYDVGGQAYSYLGGVSGQIEIRAYAQDTFGNTANDGGGVINVLYCPG